MSDPIPENAKYTVTLGGSDWSVATYGIVEFLRGKWYLRGLVAALGLACASLLILGMFGIHIPGIGSASLSILIAPWLLWAATVSGDRFQLVFAAAEATKEREEAEAQFERSNAAEDALTLDMKRLNEYYTINQTQARSSFRWAVFTMFLGFATIVAGIWIFYFGAGGPNISMAALSTTTGLVINLISGLFLHLHNKTQERSLFYYDQLASLQKISLAIRLVAEHKEPSQEAQARNAIIKRLLTPTRTSQIPGGSIDGTPQKK